MDELGGIRIVPRFDARCRMSTTGPIIGDGEGGSADELGEPVEWEGPTRPDRPSNMDAEPRRSRPEPAAPERERGDAVDDDTR